MIRGQNETKFSSIFKVTNQQSDLEREHMNQSIYVAL